MLNELSQQIYEANKAKGFWDEERPIGTILMLIVSELAEALEADRKNHKADMASFKGLSGFHNDPEYFQRDFENQIKNSFEDEIADTIIRCLDLCGGFGIDIQKHIELKLRYNSLRPHKHGKKY